VVGPRRRLSLARCASPPYAERVNNQRQICSRHGDGAVTCDCIGATITILAKDSILLRGRLCFP